jgi:iron(III) transport system ATP-binding protein
MLSASVNGTSAPRGEMVHLRGVTKRFGEVTAVLGAELRVERGEFLALLGPSGCGKTTLLRLIAGFEGADAGEIRIDGRLVAGAGVWTRPERRRVGFVFQDYALFPHLTVAENTGFGLRRRDRRRRCTEVLELVGLSGYERRYPHELSGGQQQRVALARALAPAPSLVLLDEPWSNIDPLLRHSMRDDLGAILRVAGVTVLLVTHDREEAFSIADRIALMLEGSIVQAGTAEEVYYDPTDPWAATFGGAANLVPGRVENGLVDTLVGRFRVANGGKAARGSVRALIRPELLELRPDVGGTAEVVGREFRGHDVFYRVRIADGTTLVSQRPSTEVVPLGARVALRPHEAEIPVYS